MISDGIQHVCDYCLTVHCRFLAELCQCTADSEDSCLPTVSGHVSRVDTGQTGDVIFIVASDVWIYLLFTQ